MSLGTSEKPKDLQRALYRKAKREPDVRFHILFDKVWRTDVLAVAYARNRSNAGAAGVDGTMFAQIESYGAERWLAEL